jgi:hypothetical protein
MSFICTGRISTASTTGGRREVGIACHAGVVDEGTSRNFFRFLEVKDYSICASPITENRAAENSPKPTLLVSAALWKLEIILV